MIQYVLFDFDGTLIDSNEAILVALNDVAMGYRNAPFTSEELNEIWGKPIDEQMSLLSVEDCERLVEQYRVTYRALQDDMTKIFEGVHDLLVALKEKQYPVGIVSNKGRNGIDHGIEMFNLAEFIDVSVSLDDMIQPKPHAEGIYSAIAALIRGKDGKCALEEDLSENEKIAMPHMSETIFIGDSGHDIETAKNAGCKSVLVDWTWIKKEPLLALKPDFVIQHPMDLLSILKCE